MQIVYIQESEVAPELIRALREKHGQGFGVIITCMAPPLPVLIEQHHEELVQVLAHLERQPGDEALLEKQRELSSTIDALQRAADRVSGVALDQPADGRTIAMRRAFDIRFGRDSRDAKAPPMEYLALWAAAWHAAELETMAYIGGAMVCNIDLEPALEAPAAPDLRKTRDKAGILHYLTPEQMAEEIVRLDVDVPVVVGDARVETHQCVGVVVVSGAAGRAGELLGSRIRRGVANTHIEVAVLVVQIAEAHRLAVIGRATR